jgi:drug/metabolite transporter (DMT)-like permease
VPLQAAGLIWVRLKRADEASALSLKSVRSTADRPASSMLLPVGALVLNALIWGVSWLPMRWLAQQGLHPLWATGFIFAITTLAVVLWRPQTLSEVWRTPSLLVIALASGLTNSTFNWGVVAGDVVRVVLLFYLMPLWATLLARLLLNEAITWLSVLRMGLGLAGALVVLWPGAEHMQLGTFQLADGLGIVGGFSFALNNVMLRRHADSSTPQSRVLAMFAGCAVLSGSLALIFSAGFGLPWPPVPEPTWVLGCALVGLIFIVANLALQMGAPRLPAQVTAVVMLSEVVFASVSSVIWGSQTLQPSLLMGGGLILLAAVLSAVKK